MVIINCFVQESGDARYKVISRNVFTSPVDTHKIDSPSKDMLLRLDDLKLVISSVLDISNVTSLTLTMCFLKTLPDCLTLLPLTELNISRNFMPSLPNCLYIGLENIEVLDVSKNELKCVDDPPKCVQKLCDLNISGNIIRSVPEWICETHCPCLRYLDVSYNGFDNALRSSAFKKLKKLCLTNCNLKDIDIIYSVSDFECVRVNNVCNSYMNFVDEVYFSRFVCMETLLELDLSKLGLVALDEDIGRLISLEKLMIQKNYLETLPDSLASLKKLRVLNASNNTLLNLPNLETLDNLTELYVASNLLSSICCVLRLPNLKRFDGYDNYLSDPSCAILDHENLEAVDLEQNYIIDTTPLLKQCYLKRRNSLRSLVEPNRLDGQKDMDNLYEESDRDVTDEESSEDWSRFEHVENEIEENWDNYDIDDDLYLPPVRFINRRVLEKRGPVFLDPSYYADAPDDTT